LPSIAKTAAAHNITLILTSWKILRLALSSRDLIAYSSEPFGLLNEEEDHDLMNNESFSIII